MTAVKTNTALGAMKMEQVKIKLRDLSPAEIQNSPLKYPETEGPAGLTVNRYWTHVRPSKRVGKRLKRLPELRSGGLRAHLLNPKRKSESREIAQAFKKGFKQKVIWLDPTDGPTSGGVGSKGDAYWIDATKLNPANIASEASGFVHAGNIPSRAIVKRPRTFRKRRGMN